MYTLTLRIHLNTESADVAEHVRDSIALVYGPHIAHMIVSKTVGQTSVPFESKWPGVAVAVEEQAKVNMVGNVVRDMEDKEGWRVEWCDRLTSPRFNSKGAALAYLDGLFRGRKPEYSE